MKPDVKKAPDRSGILAARKAIDPYIHRTHVLTSTALNTITGCHLYCKCENFQKGGAFKFRGASRAVMGLSDSEAARGVATHSSGNHAQALSLAAHKRGIRADIVMPENAPRVKVSAVKSYGGNITFCKPTLADREATLQSVIEKMAPWRSTPTTITVLSAVRPQQQQNCLKTHRPLTVWWCRLVVEVC